jgi:hypothetical protein
MDSVHGTGPRLRIPGSAKNPGFAVMETKLAKDFGFGMRGAI